MLMMLPASNRASRNRAMKDCDTTNALLRCDSIMASHADSGYASKRPVSSAASAGHDRHAAAERERVGDDVRGGHRRGYRPVAYRTAAVIPYPRAMRLGNAVERARAKARGRS